jgi:hypothetical protein
MPNITDIEKKYIEHAVGKDKHPEQPDLRKRVRNADFNNLIFKKRNLKYFRCSLSNNFIFQSKPWKSFLTSLPVWAILVANAAGNYGAYMLLTQMPTYLKEVLKFDIKSVSR